MTSRILLSGVSRNERHGVISATTDIVQQAGGWVEDVLFFSNIAVNLRCVVMAPAAAGLSEALSTLDLGFGQGETAALARAAERLAPDEELQFSLQITFAHSDPDLRRDVPSVPG